MNELLNCKRVIVVGPSSTLLGFKKGSFIDAFDTVIRLNKSVPLNKELSEDIGSRTDLLYHCLDEPKKSKVNVDNYIKEGIKAVVCSMPPLNYTVQNIRYFINENKNRLPFRTTDLDTFNHLEKTINTRPNSGLLCLVDLLKYNTKEIHLTGFCFYQNFYYEGYTSLPKEQYDKVAKSPAHDQEAQIRYWAKLYNEHDVITIDSVLEKIFKDRELI